MSADEPRTPETLDEELLEAEVAEVLSTLDDQTRVQRIREEIEYGFESLAHVGAAVSVFGSARTPRRVPEDELARELAPQLRGARPARVNRRRPRDNEGAHPG